MSEQAKTDTKVLQVVEKLLMWLIPVLVAWGVNAHISIVSLQGEVAMISTKVETEDERIRADLGKDIGRIEEKLTEIKELKQSIDRNTVEVARLNAKLDQQYSLLREIGKKQ